MRVVYLRKVLKSICEISLRGIFGITLSVISSSQAAKQIFCTLYQFSSILILESERNGVAWMKDEHDVEHREAPKGRRLALLLWFRIARYYNQNLRGTNDHLKQFKITASQFDALNQIGLYQPITQQELGEKLEVTKGNITQLLKRMEVAGWIKREQEWKTKYISLTEAGMLLYEEAVPSQEGFHVEQFSKLTTDEQKQLLQLLKKLQN